MQNARKLGRASRSARPLIADEASEEPLWTRRSRLLFIIGAATACWAVPVLLVYWLA